MPSIVDLSAPIVASPPETPEPLRTELVFHGHEEGAAQIDAMFGVPPHLLRDSEGWAVEEFLRLGTHSTTHVDAPWHYNSHIAGEKAQTIDELPLEWFFAPGVCLDFTTKEDGDAVTVEEIDDALAILDRDIQPHDIVLIRTGRDTFLEAPDYMLKGPGVTAEATLRLYELGVRVMGIDAWGWDAPLHMQAEEASLRDEPGIFWAAHQADLAYCQIERLCNLGALPSSGFRISCFPLKVVGGSAGPARVVAILDD